MKRIIINEVTKRSFLGAVETAIIAVAETKRGVKIVLKNTHPTPDEPWFTQDIAYVGLTDSLNTEQWFVQPVKPTDNYMVTKWIAPIHRDLDVLFEISTWDSSVIDF